MKEHKRTCGFRFSVGDAIALAVMTLLSYFFVISASLGRGWMFPFVFFHYFLFCNVFRIRTFLELIWAASFIVLLYLMFPAGLHGLLLLLGFQSVITIILVIIEMRSPRYHGIYCRSINRKHIDDWLSGKIR
jgi:hypothetical protein